MELLAIVIVIGVCVALAIGVVGWALEARREKRRQVELDERLAPFFIADDPA